MERTLDAVPEDGLVSVARVEVVRSLAALEPYLRAWESLVADALEPNVFYAPWLLVPALLHLLEGQRFTLVFVIRAPEPGRESGLVLDGVFPLLESAVPLAPRRLLQHEYCFSSTPLLRAGHGREAVSAFFGWLHRQRWRFPLLRMGGVPGEGPVAALLLEGLREHGLCHVEVMHFQRPLLHTGEDAERYLQRLLPGKRRGEYRRQAKRLSELGVLRTRLLEAGAEDLEEWLAAFIELERSGWKGASNTALGSSEASLRFFEDAAREAHGRGQLMMFELSLDGRPLAMLCDFLAAPGAYAFKMAFDEGYAKYSPGVLMELECIPLRHGLKARGIDWVDSCAAPDTQVTGRLWEGRRTLCTYLVSSGGPLGDLLVRLYPWARAAKSGLLRLKARLRGAG